MKKYLVLLLAIFLVGCGNSKKEKTEETSESTVEMKEKDIPLDISSPEYRTEDKTFIIKGHTNPSQKISIKGIANTTEVSADTDGEFEVEAEIPDSETEIVISDGRTENTIKIKSISALLAEIEEKEKEAARVKKEEEEAAKEAAAEKERLEIEEKQNKLDNAPREHRNALNKAKDYLYFSSFSKSGLYEQLIFEEFPEDAAQFAIDNIQVDWDSQALNKAIDYLDFSSFSDQGLYDQLIFEGFSPEQAQYALDNLPD